MFEKTISISGDGLTDGYVSTIANVTAVKEIAISNQSLTGSQGTVLLVFGSMDNSTYEMILAEDTEDPFLDGYEVAALFDVRKYKYLKFWAANNLGAYTAQINMIGYEK